MNEDAVSGEVGKLVILQEVENWEGMLPIELSRYMSEVKVWNIIYIYCNTSVIIIFFLLLNPSSLSSSSQCLSELSPLPSVSLVHSRPTDRKESCKQIIETETSILSEMSVKIHDNSAVLDLWCLRFDRLTQSINSGVLRTYSWFCLRRSLYLMT